MVGRGHSVDHEPLAIVLKPALVVRTPEEGGLRSVEPHRKQLSIQQPTNVSVTAGCSDLNSHDVTDFQAVCFRTESADYPLTWGIIENSNSIVIYAQLQLKTFLKLICIIINNYMYI